MRRFLPALFLLAAACSSTGPAPSPVAMSDVLIVEDMDGATHDLNAIVESGSPIALVFWSTW